MLSLNVESLLTFQTPTQELSQQMDVQAMAKKYFNFFSFTDKALTFLKRSITENFQLLHYFDNSCNTLNQTCRTFHSSWPRLHQDPSPLMSTLFLQVNNVLTITSSLSSLDLKAEEELRDDFAKKIGSLKTIQQSIDKKFQTLWRQSHTNTAAYYQKLEEYKDQTEKVRAKHEKYDKKTRESKAYNVAWVKKIEDKLSQHVSNLRKTKAEFDFISAESLASCNAIRSFFSTHNGLIEEFLKLYLNTLLELSILLIERTQENFVLLRQTTSTIIQKLNRFEVQLSWDEEDKFIRSSSCRNMEDLDYIKEMNGINHQRQEFLSSFGFIVNEILNQCQGDLEKFTYFEEIDTFQTFFAQIDPKLAEEFQPFARFLKDIQQTLIKFIDTEKTSNRQFIQKMVHQRSNVYESLVSDLSKALNETGVGSSQSLSQIPLIARPRMSETSRLEVIKKIVSGFLQIEEEFSKDFIKEFERLYTSMNQNVWSHLVYSCQKSLGMLQERIDDVQLLNEVQRLKELLTGEKRNVRRVSLDVFGNEGEASDGSKVMNTLGDVTIAEEGDNSNTNEIEKYNTAEVKFLKEKRGKGMIIKSDGTKGLSTIPYSVDSEARNESLATSDGEYVIESYSCAFVDNILLQGRIHITSDKVVFKSYFNGKTLFGSTVLYIPIEDITNVSKKRNFLGLDNMIVISTKKGEMTFTAFVFRDQAFEVINSLVSALSPSYHRAKRGTQCFHEAVEAEVDDDTLYGNQHTNDGASRPKKLTKAQRREREFQRRSKVLAKNMPSLRKFENTAYKMSLPINYNTLVKIMTTQIPVKYKGKDYPSFWEAMETNIGTLNLKLGEWDQSLPKNVSRKKDLMLYKKPLERENTGAKPLDLPVSIPFLPKDIGFRQYHKLAFVDEKTAALFSHAKATTKIPMADAFDLRLCHVFKDEGLQDGKPTSVLEFKYHIIWNYETMVKNIVVKTAVDEMKKSEALVNIIFADLFESGEIERVTQELAAVDQEEESAEEDNEEDAVQEDNEDEGEEGEAKVEEDEKIAGKKEIDSKGSGLKISKAMLVAYFSLSFILFTYLFNQYKTV